MCECCFFYSLAPLPCLVCHVGALDRVDGYHLRARVLVWLLIFTQLSHVPAGPTLYDLEVDCPLVVIEYRVLFVVDTLLFDVVL